MRSGILTATALLSVVAMSAGMEEVARVMPPAPKPRKPIPRDPEIAAWNEAIEAKKEAKRKREAAAAIGDQP